MPMAAGVIAFTPVCGKLNGIEKRLFGGTMKTTARAIVLKQLPKRDVYAAE